MRAIVRPLAVLVLAAAAFALDERGRVTSVGLPARIEELVLPGSELEVAALAADAPLALRILRVAPHGDAHRYDLEYWAYEPGEHDLRAALRRKDGSSAGDLPPILVRVESLLPPGQVRPNAPRTGEAQALGGYRALLWTCGALWALGLVALLCVGRARRKAAQDAKARPLTLADRLRPLVQRAIDGELSRRERAELELGLVAYWRRRLSLEAEPPARALATLRAHAEAGPLLLALEDWLHRPAPVQEIDLARLLEPYRALPPDAIELPGEARKSA